VTVFSTFSLSFIYFCKDSAASSASIHIRHSNTNIFSKQASKQASISEMYTPALLLALATAQLVAAHGKVSVVTGNLGGNGTALGIKGAVVAGPGPNYETEVDTTVFWSKDIATDDDLGYTDEAGNNQLTDLAASMALSGSTLPQVSSGGSVNGTFHIVTSDGAGPLQALIDETATGKWSAAKAATVTTQVPGTNGNVETKRGLMGRMFGKARLSGRATNVNEDHVSVPFASSFPPFLLFFNRELTLELGIRSSYSRRHILHWHYQRPVWALSGEGLQQQCQWSFWGCFCGTNAHLNHRAC